MEWASTHQYLDYSGEETCENCGRKYKIKVYKQKGHNDSEEYACPYCGKIYHVRACNTPEVYQLPE